MFMWNLVSKFFNIDGILIRWNLINNNSNPRLIKILKYWLSIEKQVLFKRCKKLLMTKVKLKLKCISQSLKKTDLFSTQLS